MVSLAPLDPPEKAVINSLPAWCGQDSVALELHKTGPNQPARWLWVNNLISLNPSSALCKSGMTLYPGYVQRIKRIYSLCRLRRTAPNTTGTR